MSFNRTTLLSLYSGMSLIDYYEIKYESA